jgi:hypothetical protein
MTNPYAGPRTPSKKPPRPDMRALFAWLLVGRVGRIGAVGALAAIAGGVELARTGHTEGLGYGAFCGGASGTFFILLGLAIARSADRASLFRASWWLLLGSMLTIGWAVFLLQHV